MPIIMEALAYLSAIISGSSMSLVIFYVPIYIAKIFFGNAKIFFGNGETLAWIWFIVGLSSLIGGWVFGGFVRRTFRRKFISFKYHNEDDLQKIAVILILGLVFLFITSTSQAAGLVWYLSGLAESGAASVYSRTANLPSTGLVYQPRKASYLEGSPSTAA